MSNLVSVNEFTRDQLDLIKSTVAKGASDDEMQLFLYRCKHMGLDPLKPGQIHFVKYGSNPGTVIVGIEGFRSRAAKTGKHTGTKRGVLRDEKGKAVGAWCEVYRSDWAHCAREEVSLLEYNTGKAQWLKMPETMIKKVAEAAALRMAFPDELGGIYTSEEMDQAEPKEHKESFENQKYKAIPEIKSVSNTPVENNQQPDLGDYECKIGKKHLGKKLSEIDPEDLHSFVLYIERQKNPSPEFLEFAQKAKTYLEEAFS